MVFCIEFPPQSGKINIIIVHNKNAHNGKSLTSIGAEQREQSGDDLPAARWTEQERQTRAYAAPEGGLLRSRR